MFSGFVLEWGMNFQPAEFLASSTRQRRT